MAEIGLISAIVSVAGAGITLSRTLVQIFNELGSAAKNARDVASSIEIFSMTLRQVKGCLEDAYSPHTEDAIQNVEVIVEQCKYIYEEVEDMIERSHSKRTEREKKGKSMNFGRRVQWVFNKEKV
ncbi:MAG: hypothetical protein MMC33_007030 [Icmadophila ericetorum]|nr:hypothetical protein [Icmadophila ericetorum]